MILSGPLDALATEFYEHCRKMGFYDVHRTFGDTIALGHTELTEAYEATRLLGKTEQSIWYEVKEDFQVTKRWNTFDIVDRGYSKGDTVDHVEYLQLIKQDPNLIGKLKPEGAPYELADCVIRCLETIKTLEHDADELVKRKMDYNRTRAFMHGKRI